MPELEAYRGEILLHCYRLTGSHADAEDMVQETFLRAWKGRAGLRDLGAVRPWLYRIATNVCLKSLSRRRLPQALGQAAAALPDGDGAREIAWLTPFPGPESSLETAEHVRLAFIAALQHLPPRQRAVLIFRDVLDLSARETAEILETSLASVTSALQRARASLARQPLPADEPPDPNLIDPYVRAWESQNMEALMELLREDVTMAMPPFLEWYQGREWIRRVWQNAWDHCAPGPYRVERCRYNGQVTLNIHARGQSHTLHLLRARQGKVAEITLFFDLPRCR